MGLPMGKFRINRFWSTALTLAIIYGAIKWGVPAVSRQITTLPFPLPVPGTLMFMYMALTLVALFMFVTFSEESLAEFLRPVRTFLRGDYGKAPRAVVLAVVPLVAGWQVYDSTVPRMEVPLALRIQHPSSNFPKSFEALKNPVANPSDAEVEAFIEQAKAGEVKLIPQVAADVERWQEETGADHMLAFIPTAPVRKFLGDLEAGTVDKENAKAALLEKTLFEGRALYAMNCRPCHGDSVSGDGPMADGFKLRPINFTDNGTIETIVEGYTFWRVTNGGPGLPTEATPWDSAMPEWKLNLSEEERWKIILAEYDLAQKTPRIPESH
ncbi:MAG: c-type cytochrome [Rhodospirillales bacterium]